MQGKRESKSLADGYFVLEVLPVGSYELQIIAEGFVEFVLSGVTVRLGRTTNLGVIDIGYPVYEIETIVVTAKALVVDPEATTVGGLRSKLAAEYPVLGPVLAQALFSIDQQYANDQTTIPSSAEVACIPPVSGG